MLYLIPILFVVWNYNSNLSVSNVICNDDYKHYILFFMGLMGLVTLMYEMERNDTYSIYSIGTILLGIYGLICYNESNYIHYVFASIVFIGILFFMFKHQHDNVLCFLFITECAIGTHILFFIDDNIFFMEVAYIFNFAVHYLYLHFYENNVLSNVAQVAYDDHTVVNAIMEDARVETG